MTALLVILVLFVPTAMLIGAMVFADAKENRHNAHRAALRHSRLDAAKHGLPWILSDGQVLHESPDEVLSLMLDLRA